MGKLVFRVASGQIGGNPSPVQDDGDWVDYNTGKPVLVANVDDGDWVDYNTGKPSPTVNVGDDSGDWVAWAARGSVQVVVNDDNGDWEPYIKPGVN